MTIDYLQAPLATYLDRLASRDPVPGGGSAAALSLALSAGLLSMVAQFTIGKKRFANVEAEIKEILVKTKAIRQEAASLIEEDSRLYLKYRQAVAMAKEDPARPKALSDAIKDGNHLLERMAQLAEEALTLAKPLLEKGNPYLISDVACAASFARAAFEAAEVNILINLSSQPPDTETSRLRKTLEELAARVNTTSNLILAETRKRLV